MAASWRSESAGQFLRFAIVGVLSNALGYLSYLLITHLGVPPKLAMTVVYGISAIAGYFGNRKLTFAHTGNVLASGVRYAIAHAGGYAINLLMLATLVDRAGYDHRLVQALAVVVVALYLFAALRYFVFRATTAGPR